MIVLCSITTPYMAYHNPSSHKCYLGFISLRYFFAVGSFVSTTRLFAVTDDIFCLFQYHIENVAHLKQKYGLGKNANEVIIILEAYCTLRDRGPYPTDLCFKVSPGCCPSPRLLNLNGEDLSSLNKKDLDSLEIQIDFSLNQIRSNKFNLYLDNGKFSHGEPKFLNPKCDNHASRGDSSFNEICHSKDADTPIVEIPADFNEDQVSNSIIQIDKPYPIDSEYSRGLPVQRQCANANVMRDDCGTPVPKDDRIEPGPLQKNDGSSPGDLPVESPSRVDSNDKGGELETPYASVCFNKGGKA
ncbi:hypothetical protein AgCh_016383 [Apium graveolens]